MIFVEMEFNFKKHKSKLLSTKHLKRSELFITEVNNNLPNFVRIIDIVIPTKTNSIFTIMIKTTPECILNPNCNIEYSVQLVKDNLVASKIIPEEHTYTFKECTLRILQYENVTKILESSPSGNILRGNIYDIHYEDMISVFPHFSVFSPTVHNSPDIELCKEEYNIFGGESYENEIKRLSSMKKSDHRIYNNTCYKMLVRDVKYIPHMVEPLINKLYDKGLVLSKAYTAINVLKVIKGTELDSKERYMLKSVIQGGTVVLYVDFPNLLFSNFAEEIDQDSDHFVKGTSAIEKEDEYSKENNKSQKLRLEFLEKLLNKYDLSNWHYNDETFSSFRHLAISSNVFNKFYTNKNIELEKIDYSLSEIIKLICDNYKYCNIIIAYTDTIAYSKNTFLEFLIKFLVKLNVEIKELSNTTVLQKEEDVDKLIKRIMCEAFGLNSLSDETTGIYGTMYKELKEVVFKKIKDGDNTELLLTSSITSFNTLILELCESYLSNNITNTNEIIEIKETNANVDKETNKNAENRTNPILSLIESFTINKMHPTLNTNNSRFNEVSFSTDSRNAKKRLNNMVGLVDIKRQIKEFASLVKINDIRKKYDLRPMEISKHMIFTGNPGTAKTTVASLLANILYEDDVIKERDISILSKDKLEEKYVGWTAKNVAKAIENAKGGILFVDEAYALVNEGYKGYGQEVIDTFVNYMDKKEVRENTIIIFAGYKDEMENFINTNPGIKSRIGFILDFPDYSVEELVDIAKVQAKEKGITLTPEYITKLGSIIKDYYKDKNFGNGRFVRNILEKSILKQSIRLVKESETDKLSRDKLNTLLEEDLSTDGLKKTDANKNKIGFNK